MYIYSIYFNCVYIWQKISFTHLPLLEIFLLAISSVNVNIHRINIIQTEYPKIPIIGFSKGAGIFYGKYIEETGIDGVGLDSSITIDYVKNLNKKVTLQGNLDPTILFASQEQIKFSVMKILDSAKDIPFIFNLGHGILPKTPIENVEYLVKLIRDYKRWKKLRWYYLT